MTSHDYSSGQGQHLPGNTDTVAPSFSAPVLAANPGVRPCPLFIISDWDKHFENAQSRRHEHTRWVSMPNKRGFGYNRILRSENGEAIFGAWCAIVELASTCKPRGSLQSNGIPYSYSDMSALTLYSESTLRATIELCCNELKWIEIDSTPSAVRVLSESGIPDPPLLSPILSSPIQDVPLSRSASPKAVMVAEEYRIHYLSVVKSARPDGATIRRWQSAAEMMLTQDRRTVEDIKTCWSKVYSDEFWQKHCAGLDIMREKWNTGGFAALLEVTEKPKTHSRMLPKDHLNAPTAQ